MDNSNTGGSEGAKSVTGATAGDQKNTPIAVLAYIGPLVIVSFLIAKDDAFVKFHVKQGLVLFVIEIAAWFLGMILWPIWILINLVNIAVLILSVIGIVNVVKGRERELPLVGKYSSFFKF